MPILTHIYKLIITSNAIGSHSITFWVDGSNHRRAKFVLYSMRYVLNLI